MIYTVTSDCGSAYDFHFNRRIGNQRLKLLYFLNKFQSAKLSTRISSTCMRI